MRQLLLSQQVARHTARRKDLSIVLEASEDIYGEPDNCVPQPIVFVPDLLAKEERRVDHKVAEPVNESHKHPVREVKICLFIKVINI